MDAASGCGNDGTDRRRFWHPESGDPASVCETDGSGRRCLVLTLSMALADDCVCSCPLAGLARRGMDLGRLVASSRDTHLPLPGAADKNAAFRDSGCNCPSRGYLDCDPCCLGRFAWPYGPALVWK